MGGQPTLDYLTCISEWNVFFFFQRSSIVSFLRLRQVLSQGLDFGSLNRSETKLFIKYLEITAEYRISVSSWI